MRAPCEAVNNIHYFPWETTTCCWSHKKTSNSSLPTQTTNINDNIKILLFVKKIPHKIQTENKWKLLFQWGITVAPGNITRRETHFVGKKSHVIQLSAQKRQPSTRDSTRTLDTTQCLAAMWWKEKSAKKKTCGATAQFQTTIYLFKYRKEMRIKTPHSSFIKTMSQYFM